MDLHLDKRVVVLPVDELLVHFSNDKGYRYTLETKRKIIELTLKDVLERNGATPAEQPRNFPEGRWGLNFHRWLMQSTGLAQALHFQNHKTVEAFLKRLLILRNLYEACVGVDVSGKNRFEHGFSLSWVNRPKVNHLLITWVRPRLNYQPLTVDALLRQLEDEMVDHRNWNRAAAHTLLHDIPLNKLLPGLPRESQHRADMAWDHFLSLVEHHEQRD